jgi:hypothetical protein
MNVMPLEPITIAFYVPYNEYGNRADVRTREMLHHVLYGPEMMYDNRS